MFAAPLAGAALVVLTPMARLAWFVAATSAIVAAAFALDLTASTLSVGAANGVGLFATALVACCAAVVMVGAGALLKDWSARAAPFGLALGLCVGAGWTGALLAADFVGVFLAAETAWLAGVALVALSGERERGALNGALRMLGAGAVASALFLLGVGLIGAGAGTLRLAALPAVQITNPGVTATGMGLVLTALALKAGVAPLHSWAGAAFGRGSRFAVLVLGSVGAVGALATLVRVAAFAIPAPAIATGVAAALAALGAVSVVVGSLQAIGASNVRRLAAYAGAAQAGGVLISVALGSTAGFAAALVQMFALAAAAIILLGGSAALGGVQLLSAFDGLGRRAPLTSAAMTLGGLSLMGAPLTIGFLGRWRLIEAGVGAEWWWAAVAAIALSLAGVFYCGRLIERLYVRRAREAFVGGDPWRLALAPALVAGAGAITLGLAPDSLLRTAAMAAAQLWNGAP
ncbi:MAG: proton-conducting transporter membrane subunit [Terricaulis sp.]